MSKRRERHFVPEEPPRLELGKRAREVVALVLIGASLYAMLAIATFHMREPGASAIPRQGLQNLGGAFGYYVADGCTFVFGWASFLLFVFALLQGLLLFQGRDLQPLSLRALGAVVFTAMVAILLAGPAGELGCSSTTPYGAGGSFGANLSPKLYLAFGGPGRLLVLIFGSLVSLLLATECLVSTLLRRGASGLEQGIAKVRGLRPSLAGGELQEEAAAPEAPLRKTRARGQAKALTADADEADESLARKAAGTRTIDDGKADEVEDGEAEEEEAEDEEADEDDANEDANEDRGLGDLQEEAVTQAGASDAEHAGPAASKAARKRAPRRARRARARTQQSLPFEGDYPFPPLELFREPAPHDETASQDVIDQNASAIEQRLASFKIGARVVRVSAGPAVTQYEVRVQEGIKVSKIVSFEPDLAAALKAVSVRVVAPIPGKDTVGVEVPNEKRQIVVLRELLERFGRAPEIAIPLFLGKDVKGEPLVEDLARMPHLLIAGTTGSGKSVCINSILLSILMTRTPQQVRLILIDPKMVELQAYRALPHLSCDVVTNMKKAPAVLEWAVEEMEKRYALFSAVSVNHISSYNRLGQAELEKRLQRPVDPAEVTLPYQVLVIDELADLMAVAQKEVEESIQRLAQKSRAVGLHVVLATQRPSTDVITGVIKANLPSQIAFKVSRKVDSRVILDANGAEKLLGHGDMLYVPAASHRLIRAQGTFVADEEIHAVVEFLEKNGPRPSFLPDLVQSNTKLRHGMRERDDLYDQAVEVILGQQRGSATLLQRALAVGYTRATRLLELMEEDGLVGAFNGSRSRDVLLTLEEWRAREKAMADELAEMEEDERGAEEPAVDDASELEGERNAEAG